jgi:hypothetical protein
MAYEQLITASGSDATPFTFTVTGGLPEGLTLSAAGTLSGTPMMAGASGFAITATDAVGCAGARDYLLTVNAAQPHDLAVVRLKAPKVVNLSDNILAQGKRVVVQIQNRSAHEEVIPNLETLSRLVTLDVISLGEGCPNPSVGLIEAAPNVVPRTLKPKQKMNVFFNVIFNCANNPGKGPGSEDYRYVATVHREVLDGQPDTHPECDVCPRPPLPEGDPNPDPSKPIKDKGCGGKNPDKTLGADVLTDIVVK